MNVSEILCRLKQSSVLLVSSLAVSGGEQTAQSEVRVGERAGIAVRGWARALCEEASMYLITTPDRRKVVETSVDDEDLAVRSAGPLLISGASRRGVETIARRVHRAGRRAPFPFVHQCACSFPIEPEALREHCSQLRLAAAGGSMLISNVEEMPQVVQEALLELLIVLAARHRSSAAARLISGTTVSLFDRVLAGTFSQHLFYRLNTIHLVAADARRGVALA
jgi:transcriptional regulator of aromatic amino acid metabolism